MEILGQVDSDVGSSSNGFRIQNGTIFVIFKLVSSALEFCLNYYVIFYYCNELNGSFAGIEYG